MSQEMKNLKFLLVDDDLMMLEVLKELLSETGADIDTSENGQEGFQKFSQNDYDLIISDIQMPKLNGVEFLKKVRQINLSSPKFMLLTGFSSYSRDEVTKLGADCLINKPFEFDDFVGEVKNLVIKNASGGV